MDNNNTDNISLLRLPSKDHDEEDPNSKASPKRRCIDNIMLKKKQEYVHTFTIHGLTRICTGSRAESMFWFTVLCLSLILGVVVVFGLVSKYLHYHIYTEISAKITTQNFFPSITICDKKEMESIYFSLCGGYGFQYFRTNISCNNNKTLRYQELQTEVKDGKWSNGLFDVTACQTWGNKNCLNNKYLKSLKKYNNHCFTWNYNGSLYDVYGHTDIRFKVNKSSQIIAMIHDPGIKEIDPTQRFVLDPNRVYDLKISKSYLKRLPHPFPSNCTNDKTNDMFPGEYTRKNCIETIAYTELLKKCGNIYDYHKNFIPKEIFNRYYRPEQSISQVIRCLSKESSTETKSEITKCPFPCTELELQTMLSFNNRSPRSKAQDGQEDVYRLSIQYQTVDSYKVIEEKQLYGWDQVIGEIGGLVGLVLGASVISLIEIFAYFFICCMQRLCYIGQ